MKTIRDLLDEKHATAELVDIDGQNWAFALDDEKKLVHISREEKQFTLPDFTCLSPDTAARLAWFKQETKKFDVNDSRTDQWRKILGERAIEDEEVDQVFSEFRQTPLYVTNAISDQLQRQTISIASLVPSDIRYYDRLVGEPDTHETLKGFLDSVTTPAIKKRLQGDPQEGLKRALLMSAHPWVAQAIDINGIPLEAISEFYKWLEVGGDRLSQLGGIECGLAHIDAFPELESRLAKIVQNVLFDDPADKDSRLNSLCSLFVLVEGELARTGICRQRPPFWRRIASLAHASILERAIIAVGLIPSDFVKWAMQSRGKLYYLQTFVDMRREPRWQPDLVLPDQLKAEFIGRIAGAFHPKDQDS